MAIFFVMATAVIITSLILLVLFRLILDMKNEIKNMNKELERRMQHLASEINITTSATSSIRRSICDFMMSRKNTVLLETKTNIQLGWHDLNEVEVGFGDLNNNCQQSINVKEKKREEARNSLPMEIVEDILSRLPSKCLSKFRSVCMQWNTLLSYNHHFMVEHHRKALLFRPMLISSFFNHGTIPLFSIVEESKTDCSIDNIASYGDYNMSNPVNGLVCLYHIYNTVNYIVNPSTLEIASFPETRYHTRSSKFSIGLGYDEDVRDYKVVRLTIKEGMAGCLCELLILGARNWRFLKEVSMVVLYKSPCCFFNGKLHWLTLPLPDKQPISLGILSFDVKHEKFETYPISIKFDTDAKSSEMTLKEFQRHFYLVQGSKKSVRIWKLIKFDHRKNNIFSFKGDQVYHIDMSVYAPYSVSRFRVAYADVHDDNFLFHDNDCMYHFLGGKLCKVHSIPYVTGEQEFYFFAESLIFPRKLPRNYWVNTAFN